VRNCLILVTTYGKNLFDSKTLLSLAGLYFDNSVNFRLVVRDNNCLSMCDQLCLLNFNFPIVYSHDGRNQSLSLVYNEAVLKNMDWFDIFVNLDDDTVLTQEYIDEVIRFCLSGTMPAAFPRIYSGDRLISPGFNILGKGFGRRALRSGVARSRFFMAIMSGAVFSKAVFLHGFKFNEMLEFYGIDTDCILKLRKDYPHFRVLDADLAHDSALKDDPSPIRLQRRIKALGILYPSGLPRFIAWLQIRQLRKRSSKC
jgi:hypothetical protein